MSNIDLIQASEDADTKYVRDTNKHIELVQRFMKQVTDELIQRAEGHDASKFDEPERSIFAEGMANRDAAAYGSAEYIAHLTSVAPALSHHYLHNRHHPEHHDGGILEMNLLDLIEMICDWMAASMKAYSGDIAAAHRSIALNQKRFGYSDELAQVFRNTVSDLLDAQQMDES